MSDILYVVNRKDHQECYINIIDIYTFSPFCVPPPTTSTSPTYTGTASNVSVVQPDCVASPTFTVPPTSVPVMT